MLFQLSHGFFCTMKILHHVHGFMDKGQAIHCGEKVAPQLVLPLLASLGSSVSSLLVSSTTVEVIGPHQEMSVLSCPTGPRPKQMRWLGRANPSPAYSQAGWGFPFPALGKMEGGSGIYSPGTEPGVQSAPCKAEAAYFLFVSMLSKVQGTCGRNYSLRTARHSEKSLPEQNKGCRFSLSLHAKTK